MLAFTLYLVLILWLIYRNGLFGLFKDEGISPKQFTLLFFLKALAVPAFYFIYKKLYGGIEQLDAGKFFNDATVIGSYALSDPWAYVRLLFGFQNDSAGSYDFVHFLYRANNWDNGTMKDYLYNDNRVVIRLHSLIHFIAFKSYFVHALVNCLLSYVGILFLYKSIKEYFKKKELLVLLVLCLFPALWFYTGGLLKEGLTMFVLGSQVYNLRLLINGTVSIKRLLWFAFLFFVSCLLKPYLLLFASLCFGLFFLLNRYPALRLKPLVFVALMLALVFVVNVASLVFKGKSMVKAANDHQRVFADVAKGGIFLRDSIRFIRLSYDTSLVKKVPGEDSVYTIRKHAAFMYREHSHDYDTLYCKANTDTVSRYKLAYFISKSNSNIDPLEYKHGVLSAIAKSLYYSLLHPLFFHVQGAMQWLASFENLVILLSLILLFVIQFKSGKSAFLPLVLLVVVFSTCLLIGIATPNSGAIFRYRSPVVPFILLAALYYLPEFGFKANKSMN